VLQKNKSQKKTQNKINYLTYFNTFTIEENNKPNYRFQYQEIILSYYKAQWQNKSNWGYKPLYIITTKRYYKLKINKMKKLLIISAIVILVCFCIISCDSSPSINKNVKNQTKDFNVQIMTNKGKVIHLTNVCIKTVYQAAYSEIRTDVSTTNELITYDFSLDIGPISIRIPFEIVDSLQIKENKTEYNSYYHAKVFLGNNTTLEGKIWIKLNGTGELGKTEISVEDIKSVIFKQETKKEFIAAPFGTHNVILNTVDNKKIEVSNASFVKVKANENGVWLADEPSDTLNFKESGGPDYEINWTKIEKIVHKNPKVSLGMMYVSNVGTPFTIITKSGSSLLGSIQTWLVAPNSIEGTALINNSYHLQIEIPLYEDSYKSIDF